MDKKISNDQKIKNLRIRKVLRYFIILFAILTIFLAAYSLFTKFPFYYALIPFFIYTVLKYYRDSLKI